MTGRRASSTALLIAAATVYAARDPRLARHVTAGRADRCRDLLRASGAARALLFLAESRLGRCAWRLGERLTLPGILLHYQLRKRRIAAAVAEAIDAGADLLVVIGGGLDPLALLLAEAGRPQRIAEVDHPATQALKRRAAGATTVEWHACDLARDPLPASLRGTANAVIVIEGVLMYLAPARVDALFAALRMVGPRIRVIFTFMRRPSSGPAGFRPRSRWIDAWLRRRSEPFLWDLDAAELRDWLAARGYRLVEALSMADLRRRFAASDAAMLEGEHVVICEGT